MFLESFLQDVRIGLRVLVKEKTFCILAVIVLALGICGVTTQFTVVNAFVLRGFSFPHPEELMNVGFIDPQATDNQNNNGAGNIPSSQDYADLREAQKSFAVMTVYLNGSTINVSYKNSPVRYTGGYVTEDFFRILGVAPILGRNFTAGRQPARGGEDRDPRLRDLAARFRGRPEGRRPGDSREWQGRDRHRCDAERI
ncbi:MAG: ABC transporter permease [Chthoniobacterales bacterium]